MNSSCKQKRTIITRRSNKSLYIAVVAICSKITDYKLTPTIAAAAADATVAGHISHTHKANIIRRLRRRVAPALSAN